MWTNIGEGLRQWTEARRIPATPSTYTCNPGTSKLGLILEDAFQEQSHIGWHNLIKGRISTKYQEAMRYHMKQTKSHLTSEQWIQSFIRGIWRYSTNIWGCRCDFLHLNSDYKVTVRQKERAQHLIEDVWSKYNPNLPLPPKEHSTFTSWIEIKKMPYTEQLNWIDLATSVLQHTENRELLNMSPIVNNKNFPPLPRPSTHHP